MTNPTYSLDRIRLTTGTPVCAPGKCVICGTCGEPHTKFIDFGFDIDYYGVVYFCENCILQVLTILDFVPSDELRRVEGRLKEYEFMYEAVKAKFEELSNVIKLIRDIDIIPHLNTEQLDVVEIVPEGKSDSGKTVSAKSGSVKQTTKSRSSNVRDNDSTKDPKYEL